MKVFGVLGYPVKHSLSPLMHNAAFNALKLDAEYRFFEIRPEDLKIFLKALPEKNIHGLNVTVPYKETVIPFLAQLSPEARLIGAVNTIRVDAGKLEGFNTDGEGFLRHLSRDLEFSPQGKVIAIIGAGGAARAIAVYLCRERPKTISIYDIDQKKSSALVEHLRKNFSGIQFHAAVSVSALNLEASHLCVNATPIGMKDSDPSPVEERFLHPGLLVYDLIYNPAETKLLKLAKVCGAKVANGLGMLLYQGILSFQIWTGQEPPVGVMRQALEEGLTKCSR